MKRFKTEQEFIAEYGEDWRTKTEGVHYWVSPKMDYLFGQPFSKELLRNFGYNDGMLTDKPAETVKTTSGTALKLPKKTIGETLNKLWESVSHPNYYGGEDNPYEAIKVIEAWGLDKDFYLANATKYISRAGKKDSNKEIEDLNKAIWYLQRKIERLKNEQI